LSGSLRALNIGIIDGYVPTDTDPSVNYEYRRIYWRTMNWWHYRRIYPSVMARKELRGMDRRN